MEVEKLRKIACIDVQPQADAREKRVMKNRDQPREFGICPWDALGHFGPYVQVCPKALPNTKDLWKDKQHVERCFP